MVALEHALGCGDPELLQIKQGGVSSRLLKTANEIAHAHAYAACRVFQWKGLVEMLVHPLLCAGNIVVGMVGFQGDNSKSGLPGTRRLDEQCLGGLHCNLVTAESFDKVYAEVERSIHTATTIKTAVFGHH